MFEPNKTQRSPLPRLIESMLARGAGEYWNDNDDFEGVLDYKSNSKAYSINPYDRAQYGQPSTLKS